jgi:hypothetical protein
MPYERRCILSSTVSLNVLVLTKWHAEREEISRGIAGYVSLRAIAAQPGCAPSTISREINRNGGYDSYRYLPLSLPPIRLKKEVFAGKGIAGMG